MKGQLLLAFCVSGSTETERTASHPAPPTLTQSRKTALPAFFYCPNFPVRYTSGFTLIEAGPAMNLNQTVTRSPEVISQEVSGETVLLDLDSENYFGLDEVGTRIWQLIRESGDLQVIYNTLLEEYEVEEERLQADLTTLLGEIADLGLVTLQAAA